MGSEMCIRDSSNTGGEVGTTDSFTYTITDAGGESDTATVTVSIVAAPNGVPIINDDEITILAGDVGVIVDVTANDDASTILDGAMITLVGAAPAHGSVNVVGGEVFYDHDGSDGFEFPVDQFSYTLTNPDGEPSAVATVTVNITGINDPPLATSDDVEVENGGTIVIAVLDNDTDPNNQNGESPLRAIDPTTVQIILPDPADSTQAPLNGMVVVNPDDGTVEYTHAGDDTTVASFRYTVADLQEAVSQPAQVNITILEIPNVPPVAVDDNVDANGDALAVAIGSSLSINVLSNDSDEDGMLEVGAVVTSIPTQAVVQLDGTILYTPSAGTDTENPVTFTYTVQDDDGATSNTATVTVVVTPAPNLAPLAVNDSEDENGLPLTVAIGSSVTIDVLSNDSDDGELVASSVLPSIPEAVVNPTDGSITYTPTVATDTENPVTFTYTVTDDDGEISNAATVTVVVTPVPNTIFATVEINGSVDIDAFSLYDGTETVTSINTNFEDIFSFGALGFLGFADVVSGVIPFNAFGEAGVAIFRFQLEGASGPLTDIITVRVAVGSIVNSGPDVQDDEFAVELDSEFVDLDVLGNDSDVDGINAASLVIDDATLSLGTASIVNGSVRYTPNSDGLTGVDSFTYTVEDNLQEISAVATVTVNLSESLPPVPTDLTAIHRDGQTFVTWVETGPNHEYHVYRSDSPITAATLAQATRVTDAWGALSATTSNNVHGSWSRCRNASLCIPQNFVIENNGQPLDDDTGLFVYTTQTGEEGATYYAVTSVVGGVEVTTSVLSISEAIIESVDQPTDVLTFSNGDDIRIYTQFMDYLDWNPSFNGYAYNYGVVLPDNYNPGQSYPLLLEPHAFGETMLTIERPEDELKFDGWDIIQIHPHDPGSQEGGAVHSWWYGYAADHDYNTQGNIPSAGRIENFTEQRLMRAIDFVVDSPLYNVDEDLIHAFGHSMGASGSLALGMRYPSVISGIYASQPMTDYAASPLFQDEFVQLWGTQQSALSIFNSGPRSEDISIYGSPLAPVSVWEWMDHQQQLIDRRGDEFAYLMYSHGKPDETINFETQGQPTIQAFTAANAGFSARFNEQTHSFSSFNSVVTSLFGLGSASDFPWKYPLDLSYPAIQNASGSGPLFPTTDIATVDSYNLDFEWQTPHTVDFSGEIVDLPDNYEITLRSTRGSSQTADITPRRTQQFSVNAGQSCRWTATDLNSGQLIAAGDIEVDIDSLATVVGVPIVTDMGTRLAIDCGSEDPAVELLQEMLQGNWTTGCFLSAGAGNSQSSEITFSVEGNSSVFEERSYTDLNCTVPAVSPVTGDDLVERIEDTLVFPGGTVATSLGVAPFIDFINASSSRFSIFTINQEVQNDRLFFGAGISDTPENRPLTLDEFFYYERVSPPTENIQALAELDLNWDGHPLIASDESNTLFISLPDAFSVEQELSGEISYLSLPDGYTLELNGTAVASGDEITATVTHGDKIPVTVSAGGTTLEEYELVVTNMPLLVMSADNIVDEPKLPGTWRWVNGAAGIDTGVQNFAIEFRGASSQAFDKKSFGFETREIDDPSDSDNVRFFDLRNDDDWIADAAFRDLTLVRNIVSHDIYRSMRSYAYIDADGDEQGDSTIAGGVAEVILNGRYHGIYVISERVDRKLLDLERVDVPEDANGDDDWSSVDFTVPSNGSVLYQAEGNDAGFYNPGTIEQNFEQKYPDPDDIERFEPLADLVNFINDAEPENFAAEVGNLVDLESFADFWILRLVTSNPDTMRKNYFAARNESGKWFFVPWDFDATFGMDYTGAPDPNSLEFLDITQNLLLRRLVDEQVTTFTAMVKIRWEELRADILTPRAIAARFESYFSVMGEDQTGNIEQARNRNLQRWPGSGNTGGNNPELGEVEFIEDWLTDRIDFLDTYIEGLPE